MCLRCAILAHVYIVKETTKAARYLKHKTKQGLSACYSEESRITQEMYRLKMKALHIKIERGAYFIQKKIKKREHNNPPPLDLVMLGCKLKKNMDIEKKFRVM